MRPVLEAFGVPGGERAQLIDHPAVVRHHARFVHTLLHEQVNVVEQEASAIFERDRTRGASREQIVRLCEDPRIAQHAAADEHAFDARGETMHDLLRLDAIAAAEHRDRQIAGDLGDDVPVGRSTVALRRGASVHGHRRRACVLHHFRQRRRVPLVVVPAGAHLHGDWNLHGIRHAADDSRRVLRLAHQTATRVVLRDLRHGASHVHVDDVGAHALDDPRGFGHLVGIAAEDLDRNRPLFLRVLGVLERAIDAAHEAFRADHLGHDKAASAMALHQTAKRGVGHAGHRRDGER